MNKLLLLEDDELFASTICDFLELENYDVIHVKDGEEFIELAYEKSFDLFLLDINVPKINGLDSLKKVREDNQTPCIFLTSFKDKETLTQAFQNGADDYLTKPFDIDELNLRIQSILRRSGKLVHNIFIDDVEFDVQNETFKKAGLNVPMPQKVVQLFKLFYENNGNVVTKDMIIARLWEYDEEYSIGSLRVYITKLQKLFDSKKITNIKNVGYKIEF